MSLSHVNPLATGCVLRSPSVWDRDGDAVVCALQALVAYNGLVLSSSLGGSGTGAVCVFTGPVPTPGADTASDAEWAVNGDPASEFGDNFVVADLNGDKDLGLIVGASAINTAYLF